MPCQVVMVIMPTHSEVRGLSIESWDIVFPWAGTVQNLYEAAMRRA